MSLREMHGIAEAHHLAKKIGPVAEAFQNARHLLTPRLRAPFVIDSRHFARSISIFNNLDLGFVSGHSALVTPSDIPHYSMREQADEHVLATNVRVITGPANTACTPVQAAKGRFDALPFAV